MDKSEKGSGVTTLTNNSVSQNHQLARLQINLYLKISN